MPLYFSHKYFIVVIIVYERLFIIDIIVYDSNLEMKHIPIYIKRIRKPYKILYKKNIYEERNIVSEDNVISFYCCNVGIMVEARQIDLEKLKFIQKLLIKYSTLKNI